MKSETEENFENGIVKTKKLQFGKKIKVEMCPHKWNWQMWGHVFRAFFSKALDDEN